MFQRRHIFEGIFLALFMLPSLQPLAALTAREILDRAKGLEDGVRKWDDRTQSMALQVTAADGGRRERRLQVFTKRYSGDEEKILSFILAPPELRGTGFLQWSHHGRDDEQWLYLPEFRRTRQIAARLKEESFVGTDFTYRDLEIVGKVLRWTETEAASTLLADEVVGERPCHIIELRPNQEGSPYAKIDLALDRDQLIVRKLTFFGRDTNPWKVLTSDDVRDLGSIPTAHRIEMKNRKTGSSTLVILDEVKHNSGLADDLFTQRYLERGAP